MSGSTRYMPIMIVSISLTILPAALASQPQGSALDPYSWAPVPSGHSSKTEDLDTDSTNQPTQTYVTMPLDSKNEGKGKNKSKNIESASGGKSGIISGVNAKFKAAEAGIVNGTKSAGARVAKVAHVGGESKPSKSDKDKVAQTAAEKKSQAAAAAAEKKKQELIAQQDKAMRLDTGEKKKNDKGIIGNNNSANPFVKGARAIGEGIKSTGEKMKDGTSAVGAKVAGLPKAFHHGKKQSSPAIATGIPKPAPGVAIKPQAQIEDMTGINTNIPGAAPQVKSVGVDAATVAAAPKKSQSGGFFGKIPKPKLKLPFSHSNDADGRSTAAKSGSVQ